MPWLPLTEAAEVYQCSTRTLRRYINKGKLTSKLTNGQRLVWFAEEVHTVSTRKQSIPKEKYGMRFLELYEGLLTLRMRFEGPLEMAEFLESASPPSSQEKATAFHKNCRFFFDHLDTCFRLVDKLLDIFELNQAVLLTLYRTLVVLKTHWQESGLYLREEQIEEKVKRPRDTLNIFTHLLEQVRTLLLLCAQQSTTETQSHTVLIQKELTGGEGRYRLVKQDVVDCPSAIDSPVSGSHTDGQEHLSIQGEAQRRGEKFP